MGLLISSAVLFLLVHFLTNPSGGSGAPQVGSLSPRWSAELRSAIGSKPIGVVAGGKGHEYEYKPKTSLWFADNDTIVTTFVTRESGENPKLSRHGVSDESLPLRLRAVFLDAASGKVEATGDWPAESRWASAVAARAGRIVTRTGAELALYSSDLKELKRLKLPGKEGTYPVAYSSPTGRRILIPSWPGPIWTLVDTDTLQAVASWQEAPRGRMSISDAKIGVTACTEWFSKCKPEIQIRGFDTGWKKGAPIDDRHHPPIVGFVGDDLLVVLGPSTTTLLQADGTTVFTEDRRFEGCWWGGIFPSAGGRRFVVPSCKLKGRMDALDLGGYDELRKILVYDAPFHGQSYTLDVKAPKIKELALLAISPDGTKMAILNGESIYSFELPPLR